MKRAFILILLASIPCQVVFAENFHTTSGTGDGYSVYGPKGYCGYATPRTGGGVTFYGKQGYCGYTTPRTGRGETYCLNKITGCNGRHLKK